MRNLLKAILGLADRTGGWCIDAVRRTFGLRRARWVFVMLVLVLSAVWGIALSPEMSDRAANWPFYVGFPWSLLLIDSPTLNGHGGLFLLYALGVFNCLLLTLLVGVGHPDPLTTQATIGEVHQPEL